MLRFLLFFLLSFVSVKLQAQQMYRHTLKADLIPFFKDGYAGAYEYRFSLKNSVELKGNFGRHELPNDNIFNGDWSVFYAERKTDTLHRYFNELLGSSGWEYITEQRPLPQVGAFVPKSTLQLAFGFRFIFEKNKKPWRIFLQPGFSATHHQYYEIADLIKVEKNIEDTWLTGTYPNERRVKRRTLAYHQVRSMRLSNKWIFGLGYDVGIARKFGQHFFLEGRLNTGANFSLPYEEPEPPTPAKRFWAQPVLMAGWAF